MEERAVSPCDSSLVHLRAKMFFDLGNRCSIHLSYGGGPCIFDALPTTSTVFCLRTNCPQVYSTDPVVGFSKGHNWWSDIPRQVIHEPSPAKEHLSKLMSRLVDKGWVRRNVDYHRSLCRTATFTIETKLASEVEPIRLNFQEFKQVSWNLPSSVIKFIRNNELACCNEGVSLDYLIVS